MNTAICWTCIPEEKCVEEYHDISDVQEHLLKEIEHFFATFKELQGSDVGTQGWEVPGKAQEVLDAAVRAYTREGAQQSGRPCCVSRYPQTTGN